MSFLEKARQAAEQARLNASQGGGGAPTAPTSAQPAGAPAAAGYQPTTFGNIGSQLKDAAGQAKKGFVTAVERIDPGILADIIIKATAIQESANSALRAKGSVYRIGEITITATIPPQIGFAIERLGDVQVDEPVVPVEARASSEIVAETPAATEETVVSLDGEVQPTA
jgi:hypothetical protein